MLNNYCLHGKTIYTENKSEEYSYCVCCGSLIEFEFRNLLIFCQWCLNEKVLFLNNKNKNSHAVALGRLGGLKGGKARAEALSPEERSKIAKEAAKIRWKKF